MKEHLKMNMSSSYKPSPIVIDPFILHFLASTIEPPPPLPACMFIYDPFLVVPPPPTSAQTTKTKTTTNLCNRHRYTPIQQFTLHRIFNQLPYPSLEQRRIIAEHLHLDVEQIRIWFSNRRSRQRFQQQPATLFEPNSNEYANSQELFSRLKLSLFSK